MTPGEIASLPGDQAAERLGIAGMLALSAATQGAIFSAPIAFLGILIGEWRHIRTWTYYTLLALGIALLGFFAWYSNEAVGGPTIVNNYAITAFLTTGFVGGLTYWLFSGRKAGAPISRRRQMFEVDKSERMAKPGEKAKPGAPDDKPAAGPQKPASTVPQTAPSIGKPGTGTGQTGGGQQGPKKA